MDSFDIDAELIRGSNGVFDVKVDGELIFSKDEVGHFPDESAVIAMIKERRS
jgi:selT/selW/selH-like putative selenoprotein